MRFSLFIWFASPEGADSWFAFSLTDEIVDVEEMVEDHDDNELTRYAMFLGEPWNTIKVECPHCTTVRHMDALRHMPPEVHETIMNDDLDRLAHMRDVGRFQAHAARVHDLSGLRITLN
jgi:hypothetical protein